MSPDPIKCTPENQPEETPGKATFGVPSHADRPDPATAAVRVDVDATRITMASALAKGWALAREVDRLSGLLADERLRYANLWASVRAAVHADDDGETDALAYLRTEHLDLFTLPGIRGRR